MRFYLIGLPGAGKTATGKEWAAAAGVPFYDLDDMIEAEERMKIPEIFSTYGEDYFREKEAAVLRNTDRFDEAVIACGGGTPCFFDNMDWMNRNGETIFLDPNIQTVMQQIKADVVRRPLIRDYAEAELPEKLMSLREQRLRFYAKAEWVLSGEHISVAKFLNIFSEAGDE